MTNLKQKIESALQAKSLNEIIKQSNDRFKQKTFAEKYLSIYKGAPIVRIVFSLFSIVTGVCFFMSISTTLPITVSIILGIGLYVLIELLKSKILSISLTEILQKDVNIISIFSTPIALLLFGASVYCSVYGVQSFYNSVDTSTKDLSAIHAVRIDSLVQSYSLRLQAVTKARSKYIESVSYMGKINIHNKTNQQMIASFDNRINQLDIDKRNDIERARMEHSQQFTDTSNARGFNINIWICISVFIEGAILLCLVFVSYYEFRTFVESDILQTSDPVQTSNYNTGVTFDNLSMQNKSIGFQVNEVEPSKNSDPNYKTKVLNILIENNIRDFKVLSKLGFNFSQISDAINK